MADPGAYATPCPCGKPSLPGSNPFCAECDIRVLIVAREMFPEAADKDFEREVPRPRCPSHFQGRRCDGDAGHDGNHTYGTKQWAGESRD